MANNLHILYIHVSHAQLHALRDSIIRSCMHFEGPMSAGSQNGFIPNAAQIFKSHKKYNEVNLVGILR